MTHSAIYSGTVRHRRVSPVQHAFTHRVGMLYLDLAELPGVLEQPPLWSASHRAPGRWRRSDYLGDATIALDEAVRDEVATQTGVRPEGPIRLLTAPRTFGHAFNPVSFYYCFEPDGERVRNVVAEVTNTPWGERHAYVMDIARDGEATVLRQGFDKVFHVSPFMGMDHRYAWSLTPPASTLSVHIDSEQPGGKAFDATLSLERRPLTARNLNLLLARFPLASLRVLTLIYAHAVRLKLKGAPYFRHPGAASR